MNVGMVRFTEALTSMRGTENTKGGNEDEKVVQELSPPTFRAKR